MLNSDDETDFWVTVTTLTNVTDLGLVFVPATTLEEDTGCGFPEMFEELLRSHLGDSYKDADGVHTVQVTPVATGQVNTVDTHHPFTLEKTGKTIIPQILYSITGMAYKKG